MEGEPGGRRYQARWKVNRWKVNRWKVNQVEGKPGGRSNRWKGKSNQVLEGEPKPREVKSGAL